VPWTPDELEYMRQRYERDGATSSTVAKEMTQRTGRPTTGAAVRNVANRRGWHGGGACNAEKADEIASRDREIRRSIEEGVPKEELAGKYDISARRISHIAPGCAADWIRRLKRARAHELAHPIIPDYAQDPISSAGKSLFELLPSDCCHPICRDPETNEIRFCAEPKMTTKRSSYCEKHHLQNHKPR
jgi:GcrA cell cycle regulator